MPQPSNNAVAFGFAWVLLVAAALTGVIWWWSVGRPVSIPDAPTARIACVSYAPFRKDGESPLNTKFFITPERIDEDLRSLSQRFDCIRTYSQSNGLSAVPAIAARYHMQVLMGIWISSVSKQNDIEVASGIATVKANPSTIRGVVVGNEVLLRGEVSPKNLAAYIHTVRAAIPSTIPITYADVWQRWLQYPQMAGSVDFITIHILPYWEDEPVAAKVAVPYVEQVYSELQHAFPGKQLMIGETGWPSAGRLRRTAEPSLVNEALYLREFVNYATTVHMPYNVIETFDQPWKRKLEGTVGGYWGIFDSDARPKFPMLGPVTEEPRWWWGWVAAGIGAVLYMVVGGIGRTWHSWRGWTASFLAGVAAGAAVAWQVRKMLYACGPWWEWTISCVSLLLALLVGLALARRIAAHLADRYDHSEPASWWRFGALFGLVLYDILMAFDGRYMDFPIGLFALPCIGYALFGLLTLEERMPSLEQRFLACAGPLLAIVPVVVEVGMNYVAWLWLGLNVAIALPIWVNWRRHAIGLQPQEA